MNPDTPLQLLGGLTAREFLRDYWQKKPLLVRQAIPDFESPISPDELAGLALEEEVESRLVIEHGERPWELQRGPFNEDTFQDLPERDWTLLIQAVDQFVPEVAELLEDFKFLPKWRIDDLMISFAAPGGGRFAGILRAIDDDGAIFDFNHPLAGQTLKFEVKIIGIL